VRAAYLLALLPALCLAEPATVMRATELRQAPATDAAVLAPLAESAKVETLERKGGWTRVRAEGGAEGWVRMLLLRYAGAGEVKSGDSGLVQLLNVARSGSSGTQVTTGVRGLDAEQIAKAKPNEAELKKLQGYAASAEAAADFAAGGKLQAQKVAYPKEGG
jgi:Bacterial SH3 domain